MVSSKCKTGVAFSDQIAARIAILIRLSSGGDPIVRCIHTARTAALSTDLPARSPQISFGLIPARLRESRRIAADVAKQPELLPIRVLAQKMCFFSGYRAQLTLI